MKKTRTLKKNFEFKKTFQKGRYFSGEIIEGFYIKNNKPYNSIGLAISSKLCNAVKRNRIKRIIREAYSYLENNIDEGNTFIFLYKKKVDINKCKYNSVVADMKNIFKRLDIYKNEEIID